MAGAASRASWRPGGRPPSPRAPSSTSCGGWTSSPSPTSSSSARCRRPRKALGAEVDARDDQRQRPAAPHHRRRPVGRGRRHLHDPVQLAAPLPERPRRRLRRRRAAGQGAGRLLRRLQRRRSRSAASGWPCRTRSSATPSPTGSPGSRRSGANEFPKTWDEARKVFDRAQEEGQALRPDPRPHLRRRPDLHLSPALVLRRRRDRRERQEGRDQLQGGGRVGQVHARVLEGRLRRGRPGLGRHQQQPRLPRRRDLARPSTAPRSTSSPSARRTRSRTTRASRCTRTSTMPPTRWPAGGRSSRSTCPTGTRS